MKQFFSFSFQQLGHGDTGPGSDNFGDIVIVHNFVQHLLRLPGAAFIDFFRF